MSNTLSPLSRSIALPQNWPYAAFSQSIQIDGVSWHYQRIRHRNHPIQPTTHTKRASEPVALPKLLLLHGTGASTHSWAPLVALLGDNWDCLLVDLPGHGFSSGFTTGTPTLPRIASALNELLLGIAFQPDVIGGHSAGAAIAVQMALWHCNPAGLVSINGAFLPFGSVAAPIFSKAAGWLAKARLFQQTTALHGYFRRPITKLLEETGSHPNEQMIRAYQLLMRRPAHIRGTLQMMAAWDLKPLKSQLSALRTPIELVVCANDKTVSPWQSQRLAELVVNSTLTEIPGLGHLGHEEQPHRFVDIFGRLGVPEKR